MIEKERSALIAPCGMDCALCMAHQRKKNPCAGCRGENDAKPASCLKCVIKNCELMKSIQSGFCFDCEKYPCRRLKQLDARYRKNYNMSMTRNLETVRDSGMGVFLSMQQEKWTCPSCGKLRSVHREKCFYCGR